MANNRDSLRNLYEKLNFPNEFSLWLAAKKNINPNISKSEIRIFLKTDPIYQSFKTSRKPRGKSRTWRRFLVTAPKLVYGCDLAELGGLDKYTLVCTDIHSNKIYAKGQKNKKSHVTGANYNKLIENQSKGVPPVITYVDKGGEWSQLENFVNTKVKRSTPQVSGHSYSAEKAISRLRNAINKRQTFTGRKFNFQHDFSDLLEAINNTPSPVTKFSSVQAELPANQGKQFQRKYGRYLEKVQKALNYKALHGKLPDQRFALGDLVRVSLPGKKTAFQKASLSFSKEIFRVKNVKNKYYPVAYTVEDLNSRELEGNLYNHNLRLAYT